MKLNKRNKSWIFLYFTVAATPIFSILVLLYLYDPLMQFHQPWGRKQTFHHDMRLQAAGVIKNTDSDSYILGTSMLQNSSADMASKLLGSSYSNISISGSDFYERSFPLSLALEKGAEQIIYSLDQVYIDRRKGNSNHPVENFSYLYDSGFDNIKIYFQHKFVFCSLHWSNDSSCVGIHENLDMPTAWIDRASYSERFGGIDNWFTNKNSRQIIEALKSITETAEAVGDGDYQLLSEDRLSAEVSKSIDYVEEYVLRYVRNNPDVMFELIFPPYSRIRFGEWHQVSKSSAVVHEAIVRHFATASSNLSNLNVYGYEDLSFLDNIENYKDTLHYDQWVNDMFLNSIANGDNIITESNVDGYLDKAKEKALNFDFISLGTRIEEYLDKL